MGGVQVRRVEPTLMRFTLSEKRPQSSLVPFAIRGHREKLPAIYQNDCLHQNVTMLVPYSCASQSSELKDKFLCL